MSTLGTISVVTAATSYPVTFDDVMEHCRIDATDDATKVQAFIIAATNHVEHVLGRTLMPTSLRLTLDRFPGSGECTTANVWSAGGTIYIPRPPIVSITSIKFDDANGTEQTLSSPNYTLDAYSEPARLVPSYNNYWPATRTQINAVRIVYVAGYASANAVPEDIKEGIYLAIADMYEHREESITGTITAKTQVDIMRMLQPNRVMEFV